MVVTPTRDGMNLVAKEFVAARTDGDGVLVLSEFTGAAAELAEALLVNPYDFEGIADALLRALSMPAQERQLRMAHLRIRVETYDVHRWAREFLDRLGSDLEPPHALRPSPPSVLAAAQARIREAPSAVLLLDYDGTLVEFAPTPDLAVPDRGLLELLAALARRYDRARGERTPSRHPGAVAGEPERRPPRRARLLVANAGGAAGRRGGGSERLAARR